MNTETNTVNAQSAKTSLVAPWHQAPELVVTRNFKREHGQPGPKYQARLKTAPFESYIPQDSVTLEDVRFIYSGSEFAAEGGFGCGLVCVGQHSRRVNADMSHLQPISFDGRNFCTNDGDAVFNAKVVIFNQHGTYAVL